MDELLFSRDTSTNLHSLPTELIQDIAWLSCNPDLYLVSRRLNQRLCPQRDYIRDLAYLLLCDRQGVDSAWSSSHIPWRTSPACHWDLVLSDDERTDIQRRVFELESTTCVGVARMVQFVLRSWIQIHAPFINSLPTDEMERIEAYLSTPRGCCSRTETGRVHHHPQAHLIKDDLGHRLLLSTRSFMAVSKTEAPMKARYAVHILYIPTRLLRSERDRGSNDLAKILLFRTRMDSLNHLIVRKHSATARPMWMEI